jgi:hypothetical protein
MEPIKRLEIISHAYIIRDITQYLDQEEIEYSLIKDVEGGGNGIRKSADQLTDAFNDSYLLITCSPPLFHKLLPLCKTLITTHGGQCIITDAYRLLPTH